MAVSMTTPNTLLGALAPRELGSRLGFAIVVTVLGTLLLAISAHINIPMIPVKASFQSMVVAMIAAAFGWRIGVATVALYMVEGLSGLPVFQNPSSIAYVLSPTFGFIVAWLPMAYVIGRAADAGLSRRILPIFLVMVAADAMTFVFGYLWLLAMSGGAPWIDVNNVLGSAFDIAVKPFILWDLMKMAFAAVTVAGAWRLFKRG
jgi:biotin transport system substrate-specific component